MRMIMVQTKASFPTTFVMWPLPNLWEYRISFLYRRWRQKGWRNGNYLRFVFSFGFFDDFCILQGIYLSLAETILQYDPSITRY